jgi:hypothetical protein
MQAVIRSPSRGDIEIKFVQVGLVFRDSAVYGWHRSKEYFQIARSRGFGILSKSFASIRLDWMRRCLGAAAWENNDGTAYVDGANSPRTRDHSETRTRQMTTHRYKVSQNVILNDSAGIRLKPLAVYCITAILPGRDSEPQYRVKGEHERFERVVDEHHIVAIQPSSALR